ncbi:MAG TPA: hypothetical protein VFN37_02020 [Candidatus Baltobacteraceae bacterium]|nr:hypothetical protein [Candidatus Baltobacteraceae bacterium]
MLSAGEPAQLRPLSLGELFDRAVTLYVRNAALFTLIALVVVLPLAVMNYFVSMQDSATFAQILAQVQHPGKGPPPVSGMGGGMTLMFGMLAVAIVLGAFAVVAIAAAVGELYRSGRAEFAPCYARALRRAGAILLALLCEIAVFTFVVFAGAFAMGLVFVAAFLLVRGSAALGVAAFIGALIIGVMWLVAMLLCYLAFAFAFNALGIEGIGAGAAIGRGFSRIFNRTELLRATLICAALIAMYAGLTAVSLGMSAVFETLHLRLLNVALSALISLVTTSFFGILFAVYYFDVRVRREGLDMQAQIESLQPTAAAS